jgi:hypothetical protein
LVLGLAGSVFQVLKLLWPLKLRQPVAVVVAKVAKVVLEAVEVLAAMEVADLLIHHP